MGFNARVDLDVPTETLMQPITKGARGKMDLDQKFAGIDASTQGYITKLFVDFEKSGGDIRLITAISVKDRSCQIFGQGTSSSKADAFEVIKNQIIPLLARYSAKDIQEGLRIWSVKPSAPGRNDSTYQSFPLSDQTVASNPPGSPVAGQPQGPLVQFGVGGLLGVKLIDSTNSSGDVPGADENDRGFDRLAERRRQGLQPGSAAIRGAKVVGTVPLDGRMKEIIEKENPAGMEALRTNGTIISKVWIGGQSFEVKSASDFERAFNEAIKAKATKGSKVTIEYRLPGQTITNKCEFTL